jgi:hypothetical protein
MAKQAEKPKRMELDVAPAPEAREALTLRQQATSIVVVDRQSHMAALEFIKGAKQLKRKIEEHWSRITRSVDEMKRNLLNFKREDLAPVEDAITRVERLAIDYENVERRRQAEKQEQERRDAEERSRLERQQELARLEREALKREASSPELSERETTFVAAYVYGIGTRGDAFNSATRAGYADPLKAGSRLIGSEKIQKAIAAKREAVAIREQAEARKAAPVEVVVREVESELGKVAGTSTRTTYSAKIVDLAKFQAAVLDGTIPFDYVDPNGPALNQAAKRLGGLFESAFPGCELVKKQGIAG